MKPEDIIIKPIITEKSNNNIQMGRYTFKVNPAATKVQIAHAVEVLFDVKVLKVNTMNVRGKKKRVRAQAGMTSNWKKAMVQIDTNPTERTYLTKGAKSVKENRKYKDSIEAFM